MDTQTLLKKFDDFMFLLILMVCGELVIYIFFPEVAHTHHNLLHLIDYIVLIAFSTELLLGYLKSRDFNKFLREHWLSVITLFFALGAARIFRAGRLMNILTEEEKILTATLPRGSRLVEAPIIFGKLGKVGAYAHKKRKMSAGYGGQTSVSKYTFTFYNPIELKELRDRVVR